MLVELSGFKEKSWSVHEAKTEAVASGGRLAKGSSWVCLLLSLIFLPKLDLKKEEGNREEEVCRRAQHMAWVLTSVETAEDREMVLLAVSLKHIWKLCPKRCSYTKSKDMPICPITYRFQGTEYSLPGDWMLSYIQIRWVNSGNQCHFEVHH